MYPIRLFQRRFQLRVIYISKLYVFAPDEKSSHWGHKGQTPTRVVRESGPHEYVSAPSPKKILEKPLHFLKESQFSAFNQF